MAVDTVTNTDDMASEARLKDLRARALRALAIEDTASRDIGETSKVDVDESEIEQTPSADDALQAASEVGDNVAAVALSVALASEVWPDFLQAPAVESGGTQSCWRCRR